MFWTIRHVYDLKSLKLEDDNIYKVIEECGGNCNIYELQIEELEKHLNILDAETKEYLVKAINAAKLINEDYIWISIG